MIGVKKYLVNKKRKKKIKILHHCKIKIYVQSLIFQMKYQFIKNKKSQKYWINKKIDFLINNLKINYSKEHLFSQRKKENQLNSFK